MAYGGSDNVLQDENYLRAYASDDRSSSKKKKKKKKHRRGQDFDFEY